MESSAAAPAAAASARRRRLRGRWLSRPVRCACCQTCAYAVQYGSAMCVNSPQAPQAGRHVLHRSTCSIPLAGMRLRHRSMAQAQLARAHTLLTQEPCQSTLLMSTFNPHILVALTSC